MLELPEAETIARQIDVELRGVQILSCIALAAPHKFAFLNHPPEAYAQIISGRRLAHSSGDGKGRIQVTLDEDWLLVLEELAGRVRFHAPETPAPAEL